MDTNISEICKKLCDEYDDADYVSRATVFNRALNDGKITIEIRNMARSYYGTLWNYVGD